MKCKNCSANYRARELKCPYCSTTNFLGHIWLAEKTEAELEYERVKKECGGLSRYVIYRILTRILIIEVVVGVLLFLGVVAYFFLSEVIRDLNTNHNIASIEAKMEDAWQNKEYNKLELLMDENGLDGRDYYTYTQATLLHGYYEEWLECRLQFLELSEEEKLENDSYYLSHIINKSYEIITLDMGLYDVLDEKNKEQYAELETGIKACLMGTLGLTKEEYEALMAIEYLYSVDTEEYEQKILERGAWQ